MNMMAPELLACLQVVVLTVRVFLDLWRTVPFDFSGMTSIIYIIAFSISNIFNCFSVVCFSCFLVVESRSETERDTDPNNMFGRFSPTRK